MRSRPVSVPRPRAAILVVAALGIGVVASAQESASPGNARTSSLWGSAYYQAVGTDESGTRAATLHIQQEAGLSLFLRSGSGLEVHGDFTVPINSDTSIPINPAADRAPEAAIRQLSLRISPSDSITLIAGKQRLNWGTAKVFSALNILEPMPDPSSLHPEAVSGVTGVKAVFIPDDWISLSLVVLPDANLRWSRGAGRIDILADDIGLDFGIGSVVYGYLDKDGAVPLGGTKENRVAVISDSSWSSGSLVVYEESQLSWGRQTIYYFPGMPGYGNPGSHVPLLRADVGAMLSADIGLSRPVTFIVEYLYNGDGLSTGQARELSSYYSAWIGAGGPAGYDIPDAFLGIGGFRHHYVAAVIKDVALARSILLGASEVLGIEGLSSRLELSLKWDVSQNASISLGYEHFWSSDDSVNDPTEQLFLPFQNRVTLSFSTSYQ